jgi:hypothetical protein
VPSFPIPDVLATRVVTDETFGTIAILDSLIAQYHLQPSTVAEMSTPHLIDNIPAHLTTKLSTKLLSSYVFLAKCQRTMHAVVPIHTIGEYIISSTIFWSQDCILSIQTKHQQLQIQHSWWISKLTIKWNEIVDERAAIIPNQTKLRQTRFTISCLNNLSAITN